MTTDWKTEPKLLLNQNLKSFGQERQALALVYTMETIWLLTGITIRPQFWFDLLVELNLNPYKVIENYQSVKLRNGYGHRIFQEFAKWCEKNKPPTSK